MSSCQLAIRQPVKSGTGKFAMAGVPMLRTPGWCASSRFAVRRNRLTRMESCKQSLHG
jgi:hypothetical protein